MSSTPARRRGRRAAMVGGILALVLLYIVVVLLYASGGRIERASVASGGSGQPLVLTLTPVDVDAAASHLTLRITPGPDLGSYSSDQFSMDETVHVLVTGTDGSRTITYGADKVVGAETVTLTLDGFIEQWPFDRYTTDTVIVPLREGADGEGVPIPYELAVDGRVPGWNVTAQAVELPAIATEDGLITTLGVQFTITRAASTIAFGVVLLTLMVIAPVLVLTAAITVYRGRRKIEATMLGWFGAMLFATIPLRNFLPGSPPIGSWVDYLIVLWVIAALIAGLIIFILAWLRSGPAGVAAADSGSEAPVRGDAHVSGDGSDADAGSDGGGDS